jgi:hypothetical protein
MSDRMKVICDCGCGGMAYHSQMVVVEAEQAIDKSLRRTTTSKRFWVLRDCKEPFEEELAMTILLRQLATAWVPKPQKKLWLINAWLNPLYPWPLHLFNFIRRVNAARKVMRLQHAVWERTRGFEYARTRAMNSALLFGAPRFMQGFLARRLTRRLAKAEALRNKKAASEKTVPIGSRDGAGASGAS